MALNPGSRLGSFEILGVIGAGGMGVVYRARDLKLRREVALKILPPEFAGDAVRLNRFQREAQTIAALNHPNVVTIHSVEECDGIHFLTMELIEGTTLVGLIPAGGLPLDAILRLALPITDAIVAAHRQSIVHRDLKPANVMVSSDGRVKVLDFGLAKVRPIVQESGDGTTELLTAQRHIVGTAGYMSPEQAEGRIVDARSDLFSLGVMLYEMAAGTRPFTGDSSLAILSSILRDDPKPLTEIKPGVSTDYDRIVRRCLAKDPARRYQTALDVRNELDDLQRQAASESVAASSITARPAPWFTRRPVAVVAAAAMLSAGVAAWRYADRETAVLPVRATFDQITSRPGSESFARLSPNGQWIVYTGEGTGNRDIYLQSVGGQMAINLTADSEADDEQPAFSPDGERIAFRSSRDGGGLFVMGRTGEDVRRVTRAGFNPDWSPDGTHIAYTAVRSDFRPQNAEQRGALMVVSASGGEPRHLRDDVMLPRWSPRGVRIAFSGRLGGAEGSSNIGTIPAGGGDVAAVTQDRFLNWNPVWAPDGASVYFVSNRGGSTNIWRIAIDETSGLARGDPEAITTPAAIAAHLSISADGRRLAYSAVQETQNIERLQIDPVKGQPIGNPEPVTTGSRFWANPDPSPDGAWVVFYSQIAPEGDLYVARTDGSGGLRQLTDDPAIDRVPRWSPDGEWIAMFSDRTKELQVWMVRPDGSDLRQITRDTSSVVAWSADGRRMAVTRQRPAVASIIDPRLPLETEAAPDTGRLPAAGGGFTSNSWSPDGEWLAGQAGFTTPGIVLYSFATRRFESVTDFGEWPVWLPDSRRVLFVSRGREFHVFDTRTNTTALIYSTPRDTLGPPRLTRDGRLAFYSRRVTEADVWVATLR